MSARDVITMRVIRELCDDETLTLDDVNSDTLAEGYRYADAILAALAAAGLAVVPMVPTEAMIRAGEGALRGWIAPVMHADDAYRAMIAAAQEPDR